MIFQSFGAVPDKFELRKFACTGEEKRIDECPSFDIDSCPEDAGYGNGGGVNCIGN